MILYCNCSHDYQDKRYGKYQRVMNETTKSGVYRCTVCTKERTIDSSNKRFRELNQVGTI